MAWKLSESLKVADQVPRMSEEGGHDQQGTGNESYITRFSLALESQFSATIAISHFVWESYPVIYVELHRAGLEHNVIQAF